MKALPSEMWLYLIGDNIPLDIAQKADAIYAELKYNSQLSYASDTKSSNLQFYETVPNQESNLYLYFCDVCHFAVNYRNERKCNDGTYLSNNTHYRTITIHIIVIVALLIPTTCLRCAHTTISMALSKLGNAMENNVLCSLV